MRCWCWLCALLRHREAFAIASPPQLLREMAGRSAFSNLSSQRGKQRRERRRQERVALVEAGSAMALVTRSGVKWMLSREGEGRTQREQQAEHAATGCSWVQVKAVKVPAALANARVDDAAMQLLQYPSKTAAKKACRRGEVHVDDKAARVDQRVLQGQEVQLLMRQGAPVDNEADTTEQADMLDIDGGFPLPDAELEIATEDDSLIAAVKPHGMPMSSGMHSFRSLIARTAKRSRLLGALHKPVPVHRLDTPTGGVIVCGKTKPALQYMSVAFAQRRVAKEYFAVVEGEMDHNSGIVDMPIGEKEAQTEITVLRVGNCVSQVLLRPITGRTHQLRMHMASLGHPVLNDMRYGSKRKRGRRKHTEVDEHRGGTSCSDDSVPMMLWAMTLSLPHPDTGEPFTISQSAPEVYHSVCSFF